MTAPVLRFAPSPNGRLHLGHAYSALLNAEFAAQLGGRCLLRIEDIDPGRSRPELIVAIADDLAWLGLTYEPPVRRQSEHLGFYRAALDGLIRRGLVYPCFCSRGTIAARVAAMDAAGTKIARDPDGAPLYPGTCRSVSADDALACCEQGAPHTWRLDITRALAARPGLPSRFRKGAPRLSDKNLRHNKQLSGRSVGLPTRGCLAFGSFQRDASETESPADPSRWGDAVIARRDVPTSYHLSVVLDDDAQGITHVVRGEDLLAATDLHVLLQRLLGLSSPAYHHHRLIRDEGGDKLAKSRGSETLGDLRARGVTPAEIRKTLGF